MIILYFLALTLKVEFISFQMDQMKMLKANKIHGFRSSSTSLQITYSFQNPVQNPEDLIIYSDQE